MKWEDVEAWHQDRLRLSSLAKRFDYDVDDIYFIMQVTFINKKVFYTYSDGLTGPIRHTLTFNFELWSKLEEHSKTILDRFDKSVESIKIHNAAGFCNPNGKRRLYRILEHDVCRKY